jgi:hypothetical protein
MVMPWSLHVPKNTAKSTHLMTNSAPDHKLKINLKIEYDIKTKILSHDENPQKKSN